MSKRQLGINQMFGPALTTPSTKKPKLNPVEDLTNFSKVNFIKSLSEEKRSSGGESVRDLLLLEAQTMELSWLKVLSEEIQLDYFLQLKQFLFTQGLRGTKPSNTNNIFPPAKDIYSWSRFTPLESVKVVIIGQDPYHDLNQACGLSFSVPPKVKIPPSLRNIYKELANEFDDFVVPSHGNLSSWAKSGVLLLNTALTVKAHSAGSHSKQGWEKFTAKVIDLVAKKEGKGVVFMAWGAWAAKCVEKVGNKHLILKSAHPSPLSAHRGFLGNGHFKSANEWLEKTYGEGEGINWGKLEIDGSSPKKLNQVASSSSALASDE